MQTAIDRHHKEDRIQQIYGLITVGVDSWFKAGELIAQAIDDDPEFVDKFCEKFPDVTPETVIRFELIGRRKVHPKTILSDAPGMRRLRRLPFQLQEKYVSEPVKLVIKNGTEHEVLNVDVRNLSPEQSAQVFDSLGVRSEAAQRAWLEDRAAARKVPMANGDAPYRIAMGKLVVTHPCQFTSKELLQLLAKIDG